MHILITGGTGFIGRALCRDLLQHGHQLAVYSRRTASIASLCGTSVEPVASLAQLSGDRHFDAVINLAGEGIADRLWTARRKRLLRESRIATTRALVDFVARADTAPSVLISASAVGWYGDQGDTVLDEHAAAEPDFAHELCRDWEAEAERVRAFGVRLCILRTGVVLARDGGMLQRLILPFRCGLGGRIGDGQQWLSWIHRVDVIELISFLLHHPGQQGIFNATAPAPVTNAEFTRVLATILRRPALLPVPATVLRTLLGELAQLLLGGQRVVPARVLAAGFVFRCPTLAEALQAELR
ncbi:MAG: TIGR01777 family oxidoreductase [Spongiibacteraceae bacterium]